MLKMNKKITVPKKTWETPQIFLLDSGRIQGGASLANYEIHNNNHVNIRTKSHGGTGTVPTSIYNNAHS